MQVCPEVVDMLLGDAPIHGAGGRMPSYVTGTSLASAVTYVSACRDLWEAVPGSLQRLRRIRNTLEVGGSAPNTNYYQ